MELYACDGTLRMVVDHPSNVPLIGTHASAVLLRAAVATIEVGDMTAIVYAGRSGRVLRIATAIVEQRGDGVIGLAGWQIEPGFDHAAATVGGVAVHHVTRSNNGAGINVIRSTQ